MKNCVLFLSNEQGNVEDYDVETILMEKEWFNCKMNGFEDSDDFDRDLSDFREASGPGHFYFNFNF